MTWVMRVFLLGLNRKSQMIARRSVPTLLDIFSNGKINRKMIKRVLGSCRLRDELHLKEKVARKDFFRLAYR
jgi:hypothetical protein